MKSSLLTLAAIAALTLLSGCNDKPPVDPHPEVANAPLSMGGGDPGGQPGKVKTITDPSQRPSEGGYRIVPKDPSKFPRAPGLRGDS